MSGALAEKSLVGSSVLIFAQMALDRRLEKRAVLLRMSKPVML
jgi:hypothetical protein